MDFFSFSEWMKRAGEIQRDSERDSETVSEKERHGPGTCLHYLTLFFTAEPSSSQKEPDEPVS